MKGAAVALDMLGDREAAALVVDGQLEDLWIDAPLPFEGAAPGSIHRGVVDRPAKGQGGVFVRLGGGTGFLRQARGLAPGDALLVQVSGAAEPGKAPPVTPKVIHKSRHAILTPGAPGLNVSRAVRDEAVRDRLELLLREVAAETERPEGAGIILRTAAAEAPEDEVAGDIAAMCALALQVAADDGTGPELLVAGDGAHVSAWREMPAHAAVDGEPGSFARAGVLEMLDALLTPAVPLGAASMTVEPTRALIAVDVNTGADLSMAAGLRASIAAARALPRQLRLRGLGGQVVIDFAPFPKKDRRAVEQALIGAMRAGGQGAVIGWTGLGHLEVTVKRERPPLADALAGALR